MKCANPQATVVELSQRNFLILELGPQTPPPGARIDMYVENVRVWSCADWKATMCNGTVLTGAP
jgi:hypothetical protein